MTNLALSCWTWFTHDGLDRKFKRFNRLEGGVCTMCAPGGQRKSSDNQRGGSRAISNQRHRVLKNSAGICLRTLPMISRPRIAVRTPSRSVAPPTSSQCATLMANAISRLSAKIGRTIAKSQAWAPSRKGSFVTITSPGKIDTPNRSITLRICAPNVPVKSVIPRVWAISSRCALRVRWFQRRSCITTDKLIWFVEMMSGPAFVSPVDRGCCFSVRVKKLMSVRAAPRY